MIALPAALTVYTAFNAGGFFAGTQAGLAAGMAVVLALRMTLAGSRSRAPRSRWPSRLGLSPS